MIISPGRAYIFVHIPKTGGTSVALALEARAKNDDILIGDTPKAVRRRRRLKDLQPAGRLWKHSRLSDIDGLDAAAELSRYFVFTLVRNPWDRMVSLFHWLRVQNFDHPGVIAARSLNFQDFLAAPDVEAMLRADGAAGYVTDMSGSERCDLFIRLEHLSQDIAPLERHLGFRLLPLTHENQSERPQDYRCEYNDDSAARVASYFHEDIERFAYTF